MKLFPAAFMISDGFGDALKSSVIDFLTKFESRNLN